MPGNPNLTQDQPGQRPQIDTSVASIARIYDYWLGGKDNFKADRDAAEQMIQQYPDIVTGVRKNRAFLGCSVHYLAGPAQPPGGLRFFDGLEMVEPGLVQLHRWRPGTGRTHRPRPGVARPSLSARTASPPPRAELSRTSLKSTCLDSPANNVGPWPASLGCTTNSYSSINPSSASASGSFTPPTNSPLPGSRLSC